MPLVVARRRRDARARTGSPARLGLAMPAGALDEALFGDGAPFPAGEAARASAA